MSDDLPAAVDRPTSSAPRDTNPAPPRPPRQAKAPVPRPRPRKRGASAPKSGRTAKHGLIPL